VRVTQIGIETRVRDVFEMVSSRGIASVAFGAEEELPLSADVLVFVSGVPAPEDFRALLVGRAQVMPTEDSVCAIGNDIIDLR